MDKIDFFSHIQLSHEPFDTGFTQDQVKNEPMFFNSGFMYAYENGGPITRAFLERFSKDHEEMLSQDNYEEDFVFDSRVHMLMPGWFPCIPGFHHDDVPRGENGQPDYINPAYRSNHVMGLVNGDICPTQFALGPASLSIPENDIIYKHWHPEVEQLCRDGKLELIDAPSGVLIYFDCDTLHQGQRARDGGWRWFGRLSWNTHRSRNVTNEIRRQVQVYLEYPMEGW